MCAGARGLDDFDGLDATPDDRSEQKDCRTSAAASLASARWRNGARLGQVGTADVARDLDRILAAVGDERLNFLGWSYGTKFSTAYARHFPDRLAGSCSTARSTLRSTSWISRASRPGARGELRPPRRRVRVEAPGDVDHPLGVGVAVVERPAGRPPSCSRPRVPGPSQAGAAAGASCPMMSGGMSLAILSPTEVRVAQHPRRVVHRGPRLDRRERHDLRDVVPPVLLARRTGSSRPGSAS